jgi:hypothetical protein
MQRIHEQEFTQPLPPQASIHSQTAQQRYRQLRVTGTERSARVAQRIVVHFVRLEREVGNQF